MMVELTTGAGVSSPTSTEDTITVNGVDLRLTGNITDLRVGSGIRAGYIATSTHDFTRWNCRL